MLLLFVLFGLFFNVQGDQMKAIVSHRGYEIFNEFMFNWSLIYDDVITEKDRMLTLANGDPYYEEPIAVTTYQAGLAKSFIAQYIESYEISEVFRDQLKKAIQSCSYYVDEELTFLAANNRLTYSRFGFMVEYPGSDLNFYFFLKYAVTFPSLHVDRKQFFSCTAKYNSTEHCPAPKGFSAIDWIALKIFMRASAIISFEQSQRRQYTEVISKNLEQNVQFLPPDYKPATKCPIWHHEPSDGCDSVKNPKVIGALLMAETMKYSNFTAAELKILKRRIKKDFGTSEIPAFRCNLKVDKAVQLARSWVGAEYIDEHFAERIAIKLLNDNATDYRDHFYVWDLFWTNENRPVTNVLKFGRVFVVATAGDVRTYHIGSVFYSQELYVKVHSTPFVEDITACPPGSTFCSFERAKVEGDDVLLKRYIAKKAVDALKNNL